MDKAVDSSDPKLKGSTFIPKSISIESVLSQKLWVRLFSGGGVKVQDDELTGCIRFRMLDCSQLPKIPAF